jgi:hypothetical protein
MEVVHEVSQADECALDGKRADVVFPLCFGIEGSHGFVLATPDVGDRGAGAEDGVLNSLRNCCISDVFNAVELDFEGVRAEGGDGHGEDGVGALQSRPEGGRVAGVAGCDFHAPFFQLFGLAGVVIPSNGPDLKGLREFRVCQHVADDGASLSASRAEYSECFGHGGCCRYERHLSLWSHRFILRGSSSSLNMRKSLALISLIHLPLRAS